MHCLMPAANKYWFLTLISHVSQSCDSVLMVPAGLSVATVPQKQAFSSYDDTAPYCLHLFSPATYYL
jgi:hypothetical protein